MEKIKFDLERAKAGDPVVSEGGHPVRIIVFDLKGLRPLAAAYLQPNGQEVVMDAQR